MAIEQRTLTHCDAPSCDAWEWGEHREWQDGYRCVLLSGKVAVHLCPDCQKELWWCDRCEDFHGIEEDCPLAGEEYERECQELRRGWR